MVQKGTFDIDTGLFVEGSTFDIETGLNILSDEPRTQAAPRTTPTRQVPSSERPATPATQNLFWKQGPLWIMVFPPFDQSAVKYFKVRPTFGTATKGPRDAWVKIRNMGFEPDVNSYDEWASWFVSDESLQARVTLV
jgi:hypothetical protein